MICFLSSAYFQLFWQLKYKKVKPPTVFSHLLAELLPADQKKSSPFFSTCQPYGSIIG